MAVSPHPRVAAGEALPRVAGRYELVERLAQGGMGEVYAAREIATGRLLALKRLLPSARKRQPLFRAEYHTLARLKHPYIIEVYEYGIDAELPYYTMELLDGYDLREAPQASVQEGCRMLRDVAFSLALLHGQRLLHRDLSPRNVRYTSQGICKLLDFGTMAPFGVPANVAGTAPFIAPESWEGGLLDQRADLYSLGALAYWLFSRRLPGSARSIDPSVPMRTSLPPLGKVAKEVPPALDELVMSLLERDPSRRPSSAVEVIMRLTALADLPHQDVTVLAQSHLVSSRLIGQDQPLARVQKAMRKALACSGGAVLVGGAEGAGKTRFLEEVSLVGQTLGFSVVRAFAAQAEGSIAVARELYRNLLRAAPDALERLSASERAALEGLESVESARSSLLPSERRGMLQSALSAAFRGVCRGSPWLVLVDDLDLADEFSMALVASLAAMAETLPLCVVASVQSPRPRQESSALSAFVERARATNLTELDEKRMKRLVSHLFGRVPNRERLVDFLLREVGGNPGLAMQLCSYLLERGVIGYVDGAFVLPAGEIREQLPAGAARVLLLRLSSLSDAARALCDVVATCRGSVSMDLCLQASEADADRTVDALQELIARGVLMGTGSEYALAHEGLRVELRQALDPARCARLHERLADVYLSDGAGDILRQLEASWHLMHTRRELEGAERMVAVTPPLLESGVAYQRAVEGLEKALEVLERRAAPLRLCLAVRVQLARASYLYDYRLADRYSAQTIQSLSKWCELDRVLRVGRALSIRLAALLFVLIVCFKYVFSRSKNRGPGPLLTVQYLGRTVLSTLGVRLTALERSSSTALLERIWVMSGMPSFTASPMAYRAAAALAVQPFGRELELREKLEEAIREVDAGPHFGMGQDEIQDIRMGLCLSRGINECYRVGSRALDAADELARMGTRLSEVSALRVRYSYYIVRGLREKAEEYRRALDIHGIQGGTTWQVEWFAWSVDGMASVAMDDVVGSRQALERIERLSRDIPALRVHAGMLRIGVCYVQGDLEQAIRLGREFVAQNPPGTVIGWGTIYTAYSGALNRSGDHAEAARVCRLGLSALSDAQREYVIMYGGLERELAIALAGLGDGEGAKQVIDAYLARIEQHGEHALVAQALGYKVRVGRMLGDHKLLAHNLVALREVAERTESTAVIERAAKLTRASLRGSSEMPYAHDGLDGETSSSSSSGEGETPAGGFARSRPKTLLLRALDRAEARSAYLLVLGKLGALSVSAAVGEVAESGALLAALAPHLAELGQASEGQKLRISLDARSFEVSMLPRARRRDARVLLVLECSDAFSVELPTTLLTRLARGVAADLTTSDEAESSTHSVSHPSE